MYIKGKWYWWAPILDKKNKAELRQNLNRPGGKYCGKCNAYFPATFAICSRNACMLFGSQRLELVETKDGKLAVLKCKDCMKDIKKEKRRRKKMSWTGKRVNLKDFTGTDTIGKVINEKDIVTGQGFNSRGCEPVTMKFVYVEYFDESELFYERVWLPDFVAEKNIVKRCFERVSPDSTIKLPERKTDGSAGYDFFAPCDIEVPAKSFSSLIQTGIKAYMPQDEYLALHIRSSLAIKYGLMLANNTGIVDSDFCDNPDNGGNIGVKFYNASTNTYTIKAGERIMQGIFTKYGVVDGDSVVAKREGGFGSTGA